LFDLKQAECPVSQLKRAPWGPAIRNLVLEIQSAQRVKDSTGAWTGGMDSAKWDSRYFDAMEQAEVQKRRFDRAVDDAVANMQKSAMPAPIGR
jgi:hypothetical protein